MKQFLRYQISGTTFIIWVLVFKESIGSQTPLELFEKIFLYSGEHWLLIFLAMPLGVLIHQFSVVLKNCVIGKFCKCFTDYPLGLRNVLNIELSKRESYFLERISNLNSFYYVRVDNALIAPLLAYLSVLYVVKDSPSRFTSLLAILISALTLPYLIRICQEIKAYRAEIDRCHKK